jgi:hypothetical protein
MYTMLMQKRSSKRESDLNRLAKSIVDQATTDGQMLEKAIKDGKNPAAVMLGRLGGLKGGKARAMKLSAERRAEIARNAASQRWRSQEQAEE